MTKEEAQMWYGMLTSGKLDCRIPRPDWKQDDDWRQTKLNDRLDAVHMAVRRLQECVEDEAIRHGIIRTWKEEEEA